jgi:hypothetical protein
MKTYKTKGGAARAAGKAHGVVVERSGMAWGPSKDGVAGQGKFLGQGWSELALHMEWHGDIAKVDDGWIIVNDRCPFVVNPQVFTGSDLDASSRARVIDEGLARRTKTYETIMRHRKAAALVLERSERFS